MSKDYHIYIDHNIGTSDEQTGGQIAGSTSPEKTAKKQQEEAKSGSSAAKLVGVYIGKQAFQWATSNYGNLTGDYVGQAWINESIELTGLIGGILVSPVKGSIIAGVVIAKKAVDNYIERTKANQEAQVLRERVGGILSSGGRR